MTQLKKLLIPLALASGVFSQGSDNTRSLEDLLRSENETLGTLSSVLALLPDNVRSSLSQARDVTILAPNNDAFSRFLASQNVTSPNNATQLDPGLVAALLQYHVLNGTHYASNLTSGSEGIQFLATHLTNETYANVTGGQRVASVPSSDGQDVTFISGLKESAKLTDRRSLNYTGGTVHVIDSVLTMPPNATETLRAANLTAALGAIERAGLADEVNRMRDITIFVPSNEAFAAIASLAGNLTEQQLGNILSYHVVPGQVLYSNTLRNSTVQALNGGNFTVRTDTDGSVFVNQAKVIQPDVLIKNGVVHVVNGALNPDNPTATPDTTATTQAPAFTGASTVEGGAIPFTSGVETPTSTAPVATGEGRDAEGRDGDGEGEGNAAASLVSAAVAGSALFGAGLVAFINM
ncbi:FAS1 domain-containing protein [Sodiomyces alkalinus F11]|uniref:FAS1 domain-containing protein n=1 Tax=Sodiomyces alkalinus (strain CBS 110278 / VKM F-3762 / F11) TaxID=1314773 RepID=A0A3N2PIW7_SODAK|nr:FAS1 domain-containing protein [Sodiomyces alkalinus F11]ROT34492.1 FAS1 domain-containing protein [Sodiomyces alkalinus F11]